MAYQHAKMTQLFTLLDFPARWSYPISLLVYLRRSLLQQELAVPANFPADWDECPTNYFEEMVVGKEYQTKLPACLGVPRDDLEQEEWLNQTCGGLSVGDLEVLEVNRSQKLAHDNRIAVWANDDVSPASFMLCHKHANGVFNWTPHATTRIIN